MDKASDVYSELELTEVAHDVKKEAGLAFDMAHRLLYPEPGTSMHAHFKLHGSIPITLGERDDLLWIINDVFRRAEMLQARIDALDVLDEDDGDGG